MFEASLPPSHRHEIADQPTPCRMTKQNAEYLIESASRFAKKEARFETERHLAKLMTTLVSRWILYVFFAASNQQLFHVLLAPHFPWS